MTTMHVRLWRLAYQPLTVWSSPRVTEFFYSFSAAAHEDVMLLDIEREDLFEGARVRSSCRGHCWVQPRRCEILRSCWCLEIQLGLRHQNDWKAHGLVNITGSCLQLSQHTGAMSAASQYPRERPQPKMTTIRSLIHSKAAAYIQFFNFLVRLLFKCSFYVKAAYVFKVLSLPTP